MTPQAPSGGLTVRQFDRRTIDFAAELCIREAHRSQVKFSGTSAATDRYLAPMRTLDISHGGMGLSSRLYVPRMCEGVIRLFGEPLQDTDDQRRHVVLEATVKVRRVAMTGPEPTYFIGISFAESGAEFDQRISRFLALTEPAPAEDVDARA
jgi:hypothetical protein